MVASMTAFAHNEQTTDIALLSWELKSVNHRYLDIQLKLPGRLRSAEPLIRRKVAEALKRGKIDLVLNVKPVAKAEGMVINSQVFSELVNINGQVQDLAPDALPLSVNEILQWRGVLSEPEINYGDVTDGILLLLDEALESLVQSRQNEGAALCELIQQRLDGIDHYRQKIVALLPEVMPHIRQKLVAKLADVKQELDPGRLEQEMVIYAQKMDIDEELDRLGVHVSETRRVLGLAEPIGRRLDFLMQEFNREANTIASKSYHADVTQSAVEIKVLIEQIREQVQNIE